MEQTILNYFSEYEIADKSKRLYASNIARVLNALGLVPDQAIGVTDPINDYLLEKYPNPNTRRNYLASFGTFNSVVGKDKKAIQYFNEKVQELNNQYSDQQKTGVISDKQRASFQVGMDGLNKLIDTLDGIKNKSKQEKDALLIYKMLLELPIRNELATLEFITKSKFKTLNETKKKDRNYIVVAVDSMEMIRYAYKTGKIYGEIRTPISQDLRQILIPRKRQVTSADYLFRDGHDQPLSNQKLAELLNYQSNKILGVPIGTTMFTKIRLSHEHGDSVQKLKKEADIRGHSVGVQQSVYVKTSK